MTELRLSGLIGTNPLGLFAALGAIDVVRRSGRPGRLRWTEDIEPQAVLEGVVDLDTLAALIDADRATWMSSPVLTWGPDGTAMADLKLNQSDLRAWTSAVVSAGDRCHSDLQGALVAEGGLAGKGESKPTHFHFTAGQQKFLLMARELASLVTATDARIALNGPWPRSSVLPVLGWEAGGDRVYALRGTDPSTDKKTGTPGADWLAFLGLTFFPVAARHGRLETTACSTGWKQGWFRWPLWTSALTPDVIRSVLADETLWGLDDTHLRLRGVARVMQAPIRRTDQGGYGSFGAAAEFLPELAPRHLRVAPQQRPANVSSFGTTPSAG
ncbi:MAG: type I-G CRISPR-associated protein, Cas3-extension family [Geodermatophilaceae bacterium]